MSIKPIKDFDIWEYYNPIDDELVTFHLDNTPFICYPNNLPCYEANLYMRHLLAKKLSTKVNGGTLRTYASQISHLISYCFKNNISFHQLTNTRFKVFIRGLISERDDMYKRIRENDTVIDIGKRCIDFLVFLQDLHSLKNFIGEDSKNRINIYVKVTTQKIAGYKKPIEHKTLMHRSFPSPSPKKTKSPVSSEASKALFDYLNQESNKLIRIRNLALYNCIDQTGGRRTEVNSITVNDIQSALQSNENYPFLRLITLKHGNQIEYRHVPVTKTFLSEMSYYIRHVRRKIVKKKLKGKKDHGFLFVSSTTGKPLSSDTITTYINNWRKILGIEEELHAHLFRHAYITNKIKEIILSRSDLTTFEDFKNLLLNTEQYKMELMQWTGHNMRSSLDKYIHLALAEVNGFTSTLHVDKLSSTIEASKSAIKRIRADIKIHSMSPTDALQAVSNLLDSLEFDINSARELVKNNDS